MVLPAPSAQPALDLAASDQPDLVILDLGLPDLDGVDVIRALRAWSDVPIPVLSGRSDSTDKVEALGAGADDYVTEPFGMDELLARLRALTRRISSTGGQPVVRLGDVTIDLAERRVRGANGDIRLTPTAWNLLDVLLRNPGVLLSQRRLFLDVWGPGYETAHGNLRLYMAQLRRKLASDPARPRHLLNEPGLGYRLEL